MRKRILYISDVNANEPIFHSQVLPHVNGLKKNNRVILLGMRRDDEYKYDYVFESVARDYRYPIAWLNFRRQKKSLEEFLKKNEIDFIYSRGLRGGLLGALIKQYIFANRMKMINDVRADIFDEWKRKGINTLGLEHTLKFIFKKSEGLFFVSSYLKVKYVEKFHFKGSCEICATFVPDGKFEFSDIARAKVRKELGFTSEDIVLVYSGNFAIHQNVNVILKAFQKASNGSLKLLILTKDDRFYHEKRVNKDLDSMVVRSVDYNEIQDYYSAADFGLLVRDDIPTNNCSAPTKFSEYINSGLPIVGTKIESDYCKYLEKKGLDNYLIKDKANLSELFARIRSTERRTSHILNTLSELIGKQESFFCRFM